MNIIFILDSNYSYISAMGFASLPFYLYIILNITTSDMKHAFAATVLAKERRYSAVLHYICSMFTTTAPFASIQYWQSTYPKVVVVATNLLVMLVTPLCKYCCSYFLDLKNESLIVVIQCSPLIAVQMGICHEWTQSQQTSTTDVLYICLNAFVHGQHCKLSDGGVVLFCAVNINSIIGKYLFIGAIGPTHLVLPVRGFQALSRTFRSNYCCDTGVVVILFSFYMNDVVSLQEEGNCQAFPIF